jgi:hypothetical protein
MPLILSVSKNAVAHGRTLFLQNSVMRHMLSEHFHCLMVMVITSQNACPSISSHSNTVISRWRRLRNNWPATSLVEFLTLLSRPLLLRCTLSTSLEQHDLILAVGFIFIAFGGNALATVLHDAFLWRK